MDGTSESDGRSHCAIVLPVEPRILRVHTLVACYCTLPPPLAETSLSEKVTRVARGKLCHQKCLGAFNKKLHAGRMSVSHYVLDFAFRSRRLVKKSGPVGHDL